MILGTWFGAFGAWKYGPWIGFLFAIFGGALGGLIHAVATIRFNIDQVISGVVMNLLAFFGVRYLSELVFVGQPQGGISQSPPQSSAMPKVDVPFLAGGPVGSSSTPDVLGWLEERGWFLIADLAGMTRTHVGTVTRLTHRVAPHPLSRGSCGAPVSGCDCGHRERHLRPQSLSE